MENEKRKNNYWTHETRLKELKEYIESDNFEDLDNLLKDNNGLYISVLNNNEYFEDLLEQLGYNTEMIMKIKPRPTRGYLRIFNNLRKRLDWFVDKYEHFPTKQEMIKELKIDQRIIMSFGGVNDIKNLLNYTDSKDLIDLRGDYNRSFYELFTANWFCLQGLKNKYLREKSPFPKCEGNYRSDFMFKLENEKELHVEIWGYEDGKNDKRSIDYNKEKQIKLDLYKKYSDKITLLSIEGNIFSQKYNDIQKSLEELFKPFLKLQFKTIDYEKLISPSKLTDEGLYKEVMKYSDEEKLPLTKELPYSLYYEVLKRFISYKSFGD
jgi:hypothetical protein